MKEFIFQHDANLDGIRLRYAVIKFTTDEVIKPQYAACVAIVDDEEYFEILDSILTESLEAAVSFIKKEAIYRFGNEDLIVLFERLSEIN
ncbi:hypothetical protein NP92_14520 [Anoxybacillus gonensis]|uniref:Uncharacterized protein n=1 Tax=Anoxybacillus gonensis TaxID=198467 RepID=A0AAW7TL10_9BACL|nr:hypothetical protein [Anoxybacillus gonensis]KGP59366.1 hypothetical protein NP92_14520 [Anoxybacillus gonensis]MDO0878787.1 hypothetical protein [Anoxybacillus gonensis]